MADRVVDPVYVPVTITTAALTLPTAPLITPVVVPAGELVEIDLQIPGGHGGQTGIRFTLAGQQIVPWSNGATWITGDNLDRVFDVGTEVDTGLAVVTYNAGQYPHQHLLRFKIRQVGAAAVAAPVRLVPLDQLGPAAS